ncbi:uncharacterized protein LOC122399246 [Colletes gigas]|uniref:uncharacterized protein LOC122399246 n=1 Tax=Colletes gigas TaxID=935657 RepID=UPI001C9B5EE6|nr:uncharacterized protein LOC122399246 [Colletes gigas]
MGVAEASVRKIRGDGLSLKLSSNEQILEIVGDGCTVTVGKNYGCVRVIGDACRLRIDLNLGDVEYRGDGGRVLLGPKSSRSKVRYEGDDGKITFDGDTRTKNRKIERSSKKTDDDARKEHSCNVEETENALNERREAKRLGLGNNRKKTVVKSYDGATFVKVSATEKKVKVTSTR